MSKVAIEIEIADAIEKTINIIDMTGRTIPLKANAVQLAFESRVGQKNIVMNSRQQGFSTWCIARQVLLCLTTPKTYAVGVFQNENSADYALNMARKMIGPDKFKTAETLENGSRYKAVPCNRKWDLGNLSIDSIHASELARWANEGALHEMRDQASPGCEEVVESTPFGSTGLFREEWDNAPQSGVVRHLFPWWMTPQYTSEEVDRESLTDEECVLVARYGLNMGQIGWRRKRRLAAKSKDTLESFEESYIEKVPW